MRIFVAGATGVLGRELVPQLVARGHEAVGNRRELRQLGPVGDVRALLRRRP